MISPNRALQRSALFSRLVCDQTYLCKVERCGRDLRRFVRCYDFEAAEAHDEADEESDERRARRRDGDATMKSSDEPRYLRVHERANVAVVVNQGGLPAGGGISGGAGPS